MLTIRPETSQGIDLVHHLNQPAFGRRQEADLVDKIRKRGMLTTSLVAVQDGQVIGHIAFSPVVVESEPSNWEATVLGPLAVLPEFQRKGIGSKLVYAGLDECRRLGHIIVVFAGHPEYYPRFGFVPAKARGIDCEIEVPDEAWMIKELKEDALAGRHGKVIFQKEFREAE